MRYLAVERLESLARKGITEGWLMPETDADGKARRSFYGDLSMQCLNPRYVDLSARYSARHRLPVFPISIMMRVRCRKCEWCKKMRQRFWIGRAMTEYECASRTWMGTFTCSLDEHIKMDAAARVRHKSHGVNFDELPDREKFEARCVELGAHVTLWLKRVRKSGAQFRYLMIAEAHNSARTSDELRDRPHVHMLIHEREKGSFFDGELKYVKGERGWHEMMPDNALPRLTWPLGFTRFEVAKDARTAVYLCKYLVKSASIRVRCSQRYGEPPGVRVLQFRESEMIGQA